MHKETVIMSSSDCTSIFKVAAWVIVTYASITTCMLAAEPRFSEEVSAAPCSDL